MTPETVTAEVEEFYENHCRTHGFAFSELFALAVRLTGWPLPIAFSVTARLFPFEFEFFCCRSIAGITRPRLPHAGRWNLTRPDEGALWN